MADSPAAERTLTEDELRELLRPAVGELANLPLTMIAEGWDNAIWKLGSELAVRVPRRERAAPLIQHEQFALPMIGPRLAALGVRVPVPAFRGAPTDSFPWPWSIVPWIEGDHALGRPRPRNTAWASHLAQALMALHRPAPDDAPQNPVRGVPLRQRDAAIRRRLAAVPAPQRDGLTVLWEQGLSADSSCERVWVHGDLHPGNLLVHDDGLIALIDFGDVTAGDPAYDLAGSWLAFDAAGRERFTAATGDRYDAATWVRAKAWAAAVAAILHDASDDRPDHGELGRSTALELLSEPALPAL
jgi:aminoglycoside phosphotransferase (APT) family kinase protein